MNSIIEAQLTLQEEQRKEIERCTKTGGEVNGVHVSPSDYFYLNYCKIEGQTPIIRNTDKYFFDLFDKIKEDEELRFIKSRHGTRLAVFKKTTPKITRRRLGI